MQQALKRIIWSGITPDTSKHQTAITLTNLLSISICIVILLQIPAVFVFWYENGILKLLSLFLHVCIIASVPYLNQNRNYEGARRVLLSAFCSHLVLASLLWGGDVNVHYFLLLGIFVCPFIFPHVRGNQALRWMLLLTLLFLTMELFWIQRHADQSTHSALDNVLRINNSLYFVGAVLLCSYQILKNSNKTWLKLHSENNLSADLLSNILPTAIIPRLRESKSQVADYHPDITVLFADIQGFTELCKHRNASQIVDALNQIFSAFDKCVREFGLEKIKTVGDQYMAVAGAPDANQHHATNTLHCALTMQQTFAEISRHLSLQCGLRIGIASGEAVAGVIGIDKFSYDLWGETVNLASRLESNASVGRIQVSQRTFVLCKSGFEFEFRGNIALKGLGQIPTYWLLRAK